MRILLVEDEKNLREALRDTLSAAGYTVECCANGPDALDALCEGGCDLALLDRMLPGLDGLSVLRQARGAGVRTPVLVLTALDAVGDRVEGLDAGADDYLAKPFACLLYTSRGSGASWIYLAKTSSAARWRSTPR